MTSIELFESIYKQEPEGLSFCPYRVCPLGAHSDHQLGKITGFAIDKGIRIAYRPKQNGAGGFLQVILKKGVSKEQLQARIKDVFADTDIKVWDCTLV